MLLFSCVPSCEPLPTLGCVKVNALVACFNLTKDETAIKGGPEMKL